MTQKSPASLPPSKTPVSPEPLSPITNSPSKLPRFLKYAEMQLGIINASSYEQKLRQMGYGPDILHLVEDATLKDIGFSSGDVIRLKQSSSKWWNSSAVKRQHDDSASSPCSDERPTKMIRFEKRFHDGGSATLWGPDMVEGSLDCDADFDWWYHCEALGKRVPMSRGYVPVLDGEDDVNTEEL